jgi:hypothetical protein
VQIGRADFLRIIGFGQNARRARGDCCIFVDAHAVDGLLIQRCELVRVERCADSANDVEIAGHATARFHDGLAREIGACSLHDVVRALGLRDLCGLGRLRFSLRRQLIG